MSRIIDRPLQMVLTPGGLPLRFRWQGRWFWVGDIQEYWRDIGAWWDGEPEKAFYRLSCSGAVFEVYRTVEDGKWFMYRVWD